MGGDSANKDNNRISILAQTYQIKNKTSQKGQGGPTPPTATASGKLKDNDYFQFDNDETTTTTKVSNFLSP